MTTGALNLAPHRGPSIWDDASWNSPASANVLARSLLAVGGAMLLAYGARTESSARCAASTIGGLLACILASGRLDLTRPRAWVDRNVWSKTPFGRETADDVSAASDESFPASDAPAWTATTGTGTPGR